MYRLIFASCLIGALCLCGCQVGDLGEREGPERLPSISESAVWIGGPDGGSWIECSFVTERNANWCTAWNDQDGEVITRTLFVLQDTGEGVKEGELQYTFFSGYRIELSDGRVLEPLKFHSKEHDLWRMPPIDPPRDGPPAD